MARSKIFWPEGLQAVLLPEDFCLPGDEVHVHRRGNAVIPEPIPTHWAWLDAIAGKLHNDVVEAALEDVPQQEHPALKKLFP